MKTTDEISVIDQIEKLGYNFKFVCNPYTFVTTLEAWEEEHLEHDFEIATNWYSKPQPRNFQK